MIGNIVDFNRKESYVFWEEDAHNNKVPTTPSTLSPSSLHGVGSPLLSESKIVGSDSQYCKTLSVGDLKRNESDILSEEIDCLAENSIGILGWSRNLIQDAIQQGSEESELFVYPYHSNNAEDMFRDEDKLDTGVLIVSDLPDRKIGEVDTESREGCNIRNSGQSHDTHCSNGIIMTSSSAENETNTRIHGHHSGSKTGGSSNVNDNHHHHHKNNNNNNNNHSNCGNIDADTLNMLYSRIPGYNINNSEGVHHNNGRYTSINSNANVGDNANMSGSGYNITESIFKEICSEQDSQDNHKDLSRYMDDSYLETLKTNLILEFTKSRTCYLKLVPSVIEVFRIVRDIPSRCPVPIVQSIDDLGKEKNIEKFENYFNSCITKQNCGFLAFCTEKRALKSGGGGKYYFFDRKLQLNGCHKVDVMNHHRQKNIMGPVFMKVLLFMFVVDPPYHLDPRARSSNPQRLMDFYYQLKSMNKLGSIKRLLKVWCMEMCPEVYLDAGYPFGSLLWVSTLDIETHIKKWRYRGKKCIDQSESINPLINMCSKLDENGIVSAFGDDILEKKLILSVENSVSTGKLLIGDKNNGCMRSKNEECTIGNNVSVSRSDKGQIKSNGGKKEVLMLSESFDGVGSIVENSAAIQVSLKLSQNQGTKRDDVIGSKNVSIREFNGDLTNNLYQEGFFRKNKGDTGDCRKKTNKTNSLSNNNLFVQKKTRGRGRPPGIRRKEENSINNSEYGHLRKKEKSSNNICFENNALEVPQRLNSIQKLQGNIGLSKESITELELEFDQCSDLEYSSSRFIWDSIKSLPIESLNRLYVSWLDGNIPGVTRLFVNSSPALHCYLSMQNGESKFVSREKASSVIENDTKGGQVDCLTPNSKRKREDQVVENDQEQQKVQLKSEVGGLSPRRRTVLYHKALYLVIQKHLLIHSSELEPLLRALKKNELTSEIIYSSEVEKMGCISVNSHLQTKNASHLNLPIQCLNNKISSFCDNIESRSKDQISVQNLIVTPSSDDMIAGDIKTGEQAQGKKTPELGNDIFLEREMLEKEEKNTIKSKKNPEIGIGDSNHSEDRGKERLKKPNQDEILVYGTCNQLSVEGTVGESEQNEFEDDTRERDIQEPSNIFSIISSSHYQNYVEISDISSSIAEQFLCDQNGLSKHCNGGGINEPIDLFFAIT
ncbi:hypothetical protein FG386_000353 [Cryptosporidium ryanae]|uniref:uncharacterized protein n=1 Tax=Cryptosporidium ryanae TaxID=515981 RepID=UPI003519E64A|nr:hypothetical protein FG386_000353 [Cryptosporidium ryanae]